MLKYYLILPALFFIISCSFRNFTSNKNITENVQNTENNNNEIILLSPNQTKPLVLDDIFLNAKIMSIKNIESVKITTPQSTRIYNLSVLTKNHTIAQNISLSNTNGFSSSTASYPITIEFTDIDKQTFTSNFSIPLKIASVHTVISLPVRPMAGTPWAGNIYIKILDTGAQLSKISLSNRSQPSRVISMSPSGGTKEINQNIKSVTIGNVPVDDTKMNYSIIFISVNGKESIYEFSL
ncbi:MAG: hypothetical protein ACRCVW_00955 [Brevinema sp.]